MFFFHLFIFGLVTFEKCDVVVENSKAFHVKIWGKKFVFYDSLSSRTVIWVAQDLNSDAYNVSKCKFNKGDIVIDIGGNVGMFSILLAKKFPFLKIYSFEPVKENYENFRRNIKVNGVEGIISLVQKAVTSDGRNVTMVVDQNNTGGSVMSEKNLLIEKKHRKRNVYLEEHVGSTTLKKIFEINDIVQCRLLKVDCEGCEYEIFDDVGEEIFRRIEIFRGEFHSFVELKKQGLTPKKFKNEMKTKFKDFQVTLA